MKHVKLFESWNTNESENSVEKFKAYLIKYCTKEEGKEPDETCKRALEFLDKISTNLYFLRWLNQGSTLLLQEIFRKSIGEEKFRKFWNGNAQEELLDFNAFTTIDSAGMHFREESNESYKFSGYSSKKEMEAAEALDELNDELKDLLRDRRELDRDMEEEAGEKGDKWTDADANRYGEQMNRKDEEIEKKEKEIKLAQEKLDKFSEPKEKKAGDVSYAILKKNIEDIKKSIKAWPERSTKGQAEIYKTRYNMGEDIPSIMIAIEKLKTNKLI